jgi:hypothetical protein
MGFLIHTVGLFSAAAAVATFALHPGYCVAAVLAAGLTVALMAAEARFARKTEAE